MSPRLRLIVNIVAHVNLATASPFVTIDPQQDRRDPRQPAIGMWMLNYMFNLFGGPRQRFEQFSQNLRGRPLTQHEHQTLQKAIKKSQFRVVCTHLEHGARLMTPCLHFLSAEPFHQLRYLSSFAFSFQFGILLTVPTFNHYPPII